MGRERLFAMQGLGGDGKEGEAICGAKPGWRWEGRGRLFAMQGLGVVRFFLGSFFS
jgi:hypothetical protein